MTPAEIESLGFYVSYILASIATLGCPMNGYSYIVNLGGALALRKIESRTMTGPVVACVWLAIYFNLAVIATSPYLMATVLSVSSVTVILERYIGISAVGIVGVFSS